MKKHLIIICVSILIIILASICAVIISKKHMEHKDYYVIEPGGPTLVNDLIQKKGYKVIGRCILWSPNPKQFTPEDLDSIRKKLPILIEEKHSNLDIDIHFDELSDSYLSKMLMYQFTLLGWGGFIEQDVYRLKISNETKTINIYIGKGLIPDPKIRDVVNKIEFYDETWHSNYSNPTPYKYGDPY